NFWYRSRVAHGQAAGRATPRHDLHRKPAWKRRRGSHRPSILQPAELGSMKHHVLIVDDDKDHAESIADLLQLRGYEVEVAYSGEEALELFRAHEPDVTVMDVKLPGMNGVETFFQFRKLRPEAQVIMMTRLSVDQLIARAGEGGAAGVLHKPFAMTDLLISLSQVRSGGFLLVANHEPEFAEATAEYLNANGYRTTVAPGGQDIVGQARSGK